MPLARICESWTRVRPNIVDVRSSADSAESHLTQLRRAGGAPGSVPRRSSGVVHLFEVRSQMAAVPAVGRAMIWIFERAGRRAKIELLYLTRDKYELRFTDGEGVDHVEHFTNATDAGNRQLALHHALVAEGWHRTGGWKM